MAWKGNQNFANLLVRNGYILSAPKWNEKRIWRNSLGEERNQNAFYNETSKTKITQLCMKQGQIKMLHCLQVYHQTRWTLENWISSPSILFHSTAVVAPWLILFSNCLWQQQYIGCGGREMEEFFSTNARIALLCRILLHHRRHSRVHQFLEKG